jgi:beta-galactosidase
MLLKKPGVYIRIILFSFVLLWLGSAVDVYPEENVVHYNGTLNNKVRQVYCLNKEWSYLENSMVRLDDLGASNQWQQVNLPHTWNRFDAVDNQPGYRRDAGWYRKEIFIPQQYDGRLILAFEGVNMQCVVYVNQQPAGGHTGGYVGFEIDITPFIKPGKMNTFDVRVDNSIDRNLIPSQKSDFVIYGGICRDVWLKAVADIYIRQARISTPRVDVETAESVIDLDIINTTDSSQALHLLFTLADGTDRKVWQKQYDRTIPSKASTITLELPLVEEPMLWSPDQPHLYTLKIDLQSPNGRDLLQQPFGFRWFEFQQGGPFFLNGERLLLRGTHRHEDHAGYGNALPDSLHRRDIRMIKEMGANFIRLGHYPQDPEVYRACDELGLLVWDELPWCRGGMGGEVWQENTRRLLTEQILQNYNHPSIILWSLGNEIYWLPDFSDGGDPENLNGYLTGLNELAHELDPYRLTTMRKYYDGAHITDVFSPSIWAGWYSGVYKTYKQALEDARKKYPRFMHAEYGGSSHVGRHEENPITGEGRLKENEWAEQPNMSRVLNASKIGNWNENYIVDLFDWHLMVTEQLDWFTGNAQWAFKDFATPLRPENPIPYINQKGLVDRAGNPKDAYYVFKSYWTTEPQFCYIESHTWPVRSGREGKSSEVCVYSNCEDVELILNGMSLGKKSRNISDFPATGFHWKAVFRPGENELIALGGIDDHRGAADTLLFTYMTEKPGKPDQLILGSEKTDEGYLIEAKVVDKNGRLCLDLNDRIYFDHNGVGYLYQDYGTPTRSNVIEIANGRAAIEFKCTRPGKAVIEARTQNFKGSYLKIDCD